MRRFSINLASRPFRNNSLHWTGLGVVVALLSAFTWYNVTTYQAAEGDLERWMETLQDHREAIAEMDRDIARMKSDVSGLDLVAFSERSDFANEIILSRLFSWTSLFDRLESVMPPKVRLRAIRPALGRELIEITIDGMTPDHSALLDFEEALIASEYFTFVYPVQESSKVKQGEINFSVTFGYLPEGGDSAAGPPPFLDAPAPATAQEGETAPPQDMEPEASPPGAAAADASAGKPSRTKSASPQPATAEAPSQPPPSGSRPVRPARAKRPPVPVPDLPDETAEKGAGGADSDDDPNGSDPNDADPNDDDPNDSVDPNEDGEEGGRP